MSTTIVDLPVLSMNFPPVPSPELLRDNVISTLERLLEDGARGVAVEGEEGMGKTTVLCQFARKHPNHAVSVFISAANKLSFDPDLILQDLLTQVTWIVKKEVLKPGPQDLGILKSSYISLQREAKWQNTLFFFIVDGVEELEESRRTILVQHLSCGFRGKAGTIPGSFRSAFRNESGHDSGMNPVTDSDFKPVTSGHVSEP